VQRRDGMLAFTADVLTCSRLLAAALLVWLGTRGATSLRTAVLVGVVAWTTDQLDGWAARRSATPTRLAPYDFVIDTTLYAATLAYLTLAGFLPAAPVLAFGMLALAGWLIFRHKVVGVLFVRVVDLAALVVIFEHEPKIGGLLVVWLVILAIGYRRRLLERLPRWFSELACLLGRHHGP